MTGPWIILPPWIFSVAVTVAGRWGDAKWMHDTVDGLTVPARPWRDDWGAILITNLVFLSLLPTSLLSAVHVMIPFSGARAGLALGLVAFLFGSVPMRLLEVSVAGWNRTLWLMLVDFVRIAGALLIVGWLVA